MLSVDKKKPEHVFNMTVSNARKRALHLLNSRVPEHPPEVYFIRRNDQLIDKYLDPNAMEDLIRRADP